MKTIDLGFVTLPHSFEIKLDLKEYGLKDRTVYTTVSCSCIEIEKSKFLREGGNFKTKIYSKSSLVEKNIKKIYFHIQDLDKKTYFETIELIYK